MQCRSRLLPLGTYPQGTGVCVCLSLTITFLRKPWCACVLRIDCLFPRVLCRHSARTHTHTHRHGDVLGEPPHLQGQLLSHPCA